jgi:hypothetical protein
MKVYVVWLAALLAFGVAAPAADGDVIERAACTLPAYEKTSRMALYASKSEYEAAIDRSDVPGERRGARAR